MRMQLGCITIIENLNRTQFGENVTNNMMTERVSTKAPARTLKNFERMTPSTWLYWRYKDETGVKVQSSVEHVVNCYDVFAKAMAT